MGRKKITDDLSVRTCNRGHIGEYRISPNGHAYCRACARISVAKFRGKEALEKPASIEAVVTKTLHDLELAKAKVTRLNLELQLAQLDIEALEQKLRLINAD
jgi:hypothetical protein